jgi:hypothetical protein
MAFCQRLSWCDKKWASQPGTVVSSTSCDHNLVYQHDRALIFDEYSGYLARNERFPSSETEHVRIAESDLDWRDGQGPDREDFVRNQAQPAAH